MKTRIITNSARCKKCGDVIASAFAHDFQECKCGAIAVDGGHSSLNRTGRIEDIEELSVMREEMKSIEEITSELQAFANKHRVIFDDKGECGFGRECVGFSSGRGWIDHNPYDVSNDYNRIPEFKDERLFAPDGVESYHKHDCLAVLGRGENAVRQLHKWMVHLESLGELEVVDYMTGATGMQALVTGAIGRAIRIKSGTHSAK